MQRQHNRIFNLFAIVATGFVCLAAAAALIKAASAQEGALHQVNPLIDAPSSVYYDAEGHAFELTQHKGKVVILHFWAKWCPPCIVELPEMQKAFKAMAHEDLVVLPLSLDLNIGTVEAFYKENKLDLPIVMDRKGEMFRAFGLKGLPGTVLLNKKGQIIARRDGVVDWKSIPTRAIILNELQN